MKVFIERQKKNLNLKFSGMVCELLEEIKVNPETVLVVRNDELLTSDMKINNSDEIKLLSVISGG